MLRFVLKTPKGTYTSLWSNTTIEDAKAVMKKLGSTTAAMTIDTQTGVVHVPSEIMAQTIVEIEVRPGEV